MTIEVEKEFPVLVLDRKEGQRIVIEGQCTVKVVRVNGKRVKLGIECKSGVKILRAELVDRKDAA